MKGGVKTLLAVLSVVITIGILWNDSRIVTPKEATWKDLS